MVGCDESATVRQLYERVWKQIRRFVGPEAGLAEDSNHAQEW